MTRFRHDLILRMIKLLDAVLVTIPFAMCWYLYYAKRVASPYYAKGDYLVVALFFVLFIIFGRVYDAFLMSMQRISEIIYEQFLAAAVSDFIMYIVIWLLSKHLPNILPGVAALVGQVIMASIWAYNAHHAYFKTFPPQATAVIYDTRRGMERLIGKYGLDAKYKVVSTAMAGECIENLSMLDGINTVFLSGIHSHDRNIILKYCVENNITVFVVPRIGDTIMSGAHHMHMLCVDNVLNGLPFMVVIFGCVICLLILVLPKKMSVLLTAAYIAFILYETLMFREAGDARTNFVLFSYADRFLTEQSVRVGVINNIWLFIPLGTGLYRWFQKKWVLQIPFVMSVAIETTQYVTGLGIAEFDDVFGNTMGGWIGVLTAWVWLSRKMSLKNRA